VIAAAIAAHPEDFQDTLAQLPGKRENDQLEMIDRSRSPRQISLGFSADRDRVPRIGNRRYVDEIAFLWIAPFCSLPLPCLEPHCHQPQCHKP
jgi:hypothetical protein